MIWVPPFQETTIFLIIQEIWFFLRKRPEGITRSDGLRMFEVKASWSCHQVALSERLGRIVSHGGLEWDLTQESLLPSSGLILGGLLLEVSKLWGLLWDLNKSTVPGWCHFCAISGAISKVMCCSQPLETWSHWSCGSWSNWTWPMIGKHGAIPLRWGGEKQHFATLGPCRPPKD